MNRARAISGSGVGASLGLAPPMGDPASASPTVQGSIPAVTQARAEISDLMEGRVSLIMLNTIVITMVAFYLWTRKAQGGG